MRPVALVSAAFLGASALFAGAAFPVSAQERSDPRDLSGRYRSTGDSTKVVSLTAVAIGVFQVVGDGWEGVGLFDGTTYWGVFRRGREPATPRYGTHRGMLRGDGSLVVHGEYPDGGGTPFDVVWTPDRASASRRPGPPSPPSEPRIVPKPPPQKEGELPALGDYVYVEELPEAITKVPPSYPQAAREANVEGTVLVQVLVGRDGRIADTKVVKSIPELDDAAVASARQWVFKPAMTAGKPVAVWVAVPIKFSLR